MYIAFLFTLKSETVSISCSLVANLKFIETILSTFLRPLPWRQRLDHPNIVLVVENFILNHVEVLKIVKAVENTRGHVCFWAVFRGF